MGRYSNYRDPNYYAQGYNYSGDNRIDKIKWIMPDLDKDRFHSHEDFYDESFISTIRLEEDDKKISLFCVGSDGKDLTKKIVHKKKTSTPATTEQVQEVEMEG